MKKKRKKDKSHFVMIIFYRKIWNHIMLFCLFFLTMQIFSKHEFWYVSININMISIWSLMLEIENDVGTYEITSEILVCPTHWRVDRLKLSICFNIKLLTQETNNVNNRQVANSIVKILFQNILDHGGIHETIAIY